MVITGHREIQDHRKATDNTQVLVQKNNDLLNTQADLILSISKNFALYVSVVDTPYNKVLRDFDQ